MSNKEPEVNDIQETKRAEALFERISALIEQSRQFVASTVNIAEVKTRYEVGRYIFEDEQQGERATYGKQFFKKLSVRLMERFGNDWSYDTLKRCRFFYQAYEKAVIGATLCPNWERAKKVSGDVYLRASLSIMATSSDIPMLH